MIRPLLVLTLLAIMIAPVRGAESPPSLDAAAPTTPTLAAEGPGIHLFPLLYRGVDWEPGVVEWSIFGPLLGARRDLATTDTFYAARPLMSAGTNADGRFLDLLFPLGGRRLRQERADELERRWAMPIYFHSRTENPVSMRERSVFFPLVYRGSRRTGDQTAGYFIFLPFYWNVEEGASYYFPLFHPNPGRSLVFWPLYGHFRRAFGADEIRFWAWPGYVETIDAPNRTRTILWPFFSRTSGQTLNGWRVWPLAARYERAGGGRRDWYLWPLGWHVRRPAQGNRSELALDAFLPFYLKMSQGEMNARYYAVWGESIRPTQRTSAWLWPLYTHTVSLSPEFTRHRVLLFLVDVLRGEGPRRTIVFPFYGRREDERQLRRFVLFPFYSDRRQQLADGGVYTSRYLLPFVVSQRWVDADDRPLRSRFTLAPFYRDIRNADGSSYLSWPHLLPYTEQAGMDRNWAPLWTIYSRRNDGAGTVERRVLGKLWRSRTVEGVGTEREFNFLLGRWRRHLDGGASFSLLGFELAG